jgi:hypothetical protein
MVDMMVVLTNEFVEALNRITDERSQISYNLAMIRREQIKVKSPPKVPADKQKKLGVWPK